MVRRVASRVSIKIEEKSELHRNGAAHADAVIGAEARTAALNVGVHRVIAIGNGRCDHFADFRQNSGGGTAVSCSGGVDQMTLMGVERGNLTVRPGIFIAGLRVIRARNTGVK